MKKGTKVSFMVPSRTRAQPRRIHGTIALAYRGWAEIRHRHGQHILTYACPISEIQYDR